MKTKNIVIIVVIIALVGIGAWVLLGGKGLEKGIIPPGEKAKEGAESLTDILAKAKDIVSYKYEGAVTGPKGEVITAKFWLKEYKLRWEGTYEEKSAVYLIDEEKLTSYLYIPAQNIAIKMDWSQAKGTVGESPAEQSESIEERQPEIVGTEILDGKTCLVIEYTDEAGKTKMWIWTKYGFPIRTEITTDEGTTVVEVKNIEFVDIPDSMFELPAGVQIMEIPFGF